MGRGEGSGWGFGKGSGDYKGKFERMWMPALPMPMATLCCVLNFLVPGLGTVIAGLCVFCCARNEDMDKASKGVSCLMSCGIGFAQLVTALLMFVGWVWSCYWGMAFLMSSADYYHDNRADEYDRGTAVTTTVPTTHIVYEHGSANPSAIIMQPAHVPFQVIQPRVHPGPGVIINQPERPPPYPGTTYGGINPSGSLYPNPPLVIHANGSEQKIGL